MPRLRVALAAAVAAVLPLALTACGSADAEKSGGSSGSSEVTITHAQGDTTVPVSPEKVVVLDYGALDTIDTLGVDGVVGVPQGSLPDFLSDYANDDVTDVGTLKEPDFEAIAGLEPDLIIIGGRSAATYGELSELAPTVDLTVDSTNFMASFKESATSIGEIFDKADEVETKLGEIDTKVEEVKADAAEGDNALLIMVSGGKLSAYGQGSRFGFIHDELGIPAADPNLAVDSHGQAISFEFIAQNNPQQIFVIDRDSAIGEDGAAAKQVLDNDLVNGTDAAKNDSVVYLSSARWYLVGAGLGNIPAMIDEVTGSGA